MLDVHARALHYLGMSSISFTHRRALHVVACLALCGTGAAAQTAADYTRALDLEERYEALVSGLPGQASWIGTSHEFFYRRSVPGGHEFVRVDAASG